MQPIPSPEMETKEFQPGEKHHACILAIGKAVPPNKIAQKDYADFYFRATHSDHKTALKQRMERICNRSKISTRYSILTEEFLRSHPQFYTPGFPSLEQRNELFSEEVPKLAHEAACKAIQEWGRPVSEITHIVVTTSAEVSIPGADVKLTKSLGLRLDVNRLMLYMLGSHAGLTSLRIAKGLAMTDPSSRILICCSELAASTFRAPDERSPYEMVSTALSGDGAAALIVGARPVVQIERPLYEIHWAGETLISDTQKIFEGSLHVDGLRLFMDRQLPSVLASNLPAFCNKILEKVPGQLSLNDAFWAIHPAAPAILDAIQDALELQSDKLAATRHILANYGNISAPTVLLVLDELRQFPATNSQSHTAADWGVVIAYGPGLTIEGALLRRLV